MASIFDITFSLQADNILPPSKRKPKNMGFIYALLYPLQWLRDLLFDDYRLGASYQDWDAISGFPYGARVRYSDKSIYECNNLLGAFGAGQSPVNTDYWYKIQDNFIGVNERVKYNSQMIVLEYALNTWFLIPNTDPQIYLLTNAIGSSSFIMANTGPLSSNLVNNSLIAANFLSNAYIAPPANTNFTVYFPIAVFNALPPALNADKVKIINQFIDKYRLAGLTYNIVTF